MDDEVLFRYLRHKTTESEERDVVAWRRLSPDNEARLQQLSRLLAVTADSDERRMAGARQLEAADILRRSEARATRRSRNPWRLAAGICAAAVLLLALGLWRELCRQPSLASPRFREIVTGPNDEVTVTLADGSVVRLAPNSRLQTDSANSHDLVLEGHAYFAVAKQKHGPLFIRTAAGVVQVVGTRFDLQSTGDQLRLIVVEGVVLLSAHGSVSRLSAGELARVREGVPGPVVEMPRTLPPLDWLGNFLAFQDTPVRDAARDIEREFNVRVQIADSALGARTVTGWFAGWKLHDLLDVICVVANAECTESGGVVIMRQHRIQ